MGNIKYNLESMTGVDKEKLFKEGGQRTNRFSAAGPFSGEVQSQTQKAINNNFFVTETKDAEQVIAEALKNKTPQTITEEGSKKKNKKKK